MPCDEEGAADGACAPGWSPLCAAGMTCGGGAAGARCVSCAGGPADSGEAGGPGGGSGGASEFRSTVTASWIGRPSSVESACVTNGRSRVSSCSLTNALGVAITAVFSTRASGRVSLSQASWLGWTRSSASPSSDRAHTSARSGSVTMRSPRVAALQSLINDHARCPQGGPHDVHAVRRGRPYAVPHCVHRRCAAVSPPMAAAVPRGPVRGR